MSEIRRATVDDAGEIHRLLVDRMYPEMLADGVPLPPVDRRKVMDEVLRAIDHGATFLAERDGAIIGALQTVPIQPWWSTQVVMQERGYYVVPEARKSRAALGLLKAARAMAHDAKVPLWCGVYGVADLDRKTRYMEIAGLELTGASFVGGS